MVMETSPGTAFKVIQAQVVLGALKVLFDVPAGAAQFQAAAFGGRSMEMGQVIVIGFGVPCRPVHQPAGNSDGRLPCQPAGSGDAGDPEK